MKNDQFKEGQTIRAYEFRPMPGRPDRFHEGVITGVFPNGNTEEPMLLHAHYVVWDSRINDEIFVPMEIFMMDWDDRIQLVDIDGKYEEESIKWSWDTCEKDLNNFLETWS